MPLALSQLAYKGCNWGWGGDFAQNLRKEGVIKVKKTIWKRIL